MEVPNTPRGAIVTEHSMDHDMLRLHRSQLDGYPVEIHRCL